MDFLDVIYQAARSQYPKGVAHAPDAVRIDDRMQLQQLMAILTMDGEIPILLHIGAQIFDYHSTLKMAGGIGSSEKNLYLLIKALVPPIGNVRIRHADVITISMNSKHFNFLMDVTFVEQVSKNILKISFPSEIMIRTEKRKSVRVNVDPAWNVSLEAAVGRKEVFKPELENISYGGFYFKAAGKRPNLSPGQKISFRMRWPDIKLDTKVETVLIEMCSKYGDPFFRSHFTFETYDKTMQQIESFVAAAQSVHLQYRKALFGHWELNLEKNNP
ncbi:MAG: PilZ domain-containing protein [Magnetococcales bacterium]|nr:PilZ domain-containing protein [Magnetococcales bacterium]